MAHKLLGQEHRSWGNSYPPFLFINKISNIILRIQGKAPIRIKDAILVEGITEHNETNAAEEGTTQDPLTPKTYYLLTDDNTYGNDMVYDKPVTSFSPFSGDTTYERYNFKTAVQLMEGAFSRVKKVSKKYQDALNFLCCSYTGFTPFGTNSINDLIATQFVESEGVHGTIKYTPEKSIVVGDNATAEVFDHKIDLTPQAGDPSVLSHAGKHISQMGAMSKLMKNPSLETLNSPEFDEIRNSLSAEEVDEIKQSLQELTNNPEHLNALRALHYTEGGGLVVKDRQGNDLFTAKNILKFTNTQFKAMKKALGLEGLQPDNFAEEMVEETE